MTTIPGMRRTLYRSARVLGDIDAARRGPAAYGRRVARKAAYRGGGRGLYRLLRAVGLGR